MLVKKTARRTWTRQNRISLLPCLHRKHLKRRLIHHSSKNLDLFSGVCDAGKQLIMNTASIYLTFGLLTCMTSH